MTQSHDQLHRIKALSAFNIQGASRRKLNQHLTRYIFSDQSRLDIFSTASQGVAYDANGQRIASHKLKINKQGN